MPRHPVTLTYNPVWIDGERATKDPIRITWERPSRGRTGIGKPLFSRFESCTLEIGVCTETQFSWWKDKWMEDILHTVLMPCENPLTTGTIENDVCTFTGVSIDDLRWSRVDEFQLGVTAVLGHILIT